MITDPSTGGGQGGRQAPGRQEPAAATGSGDLRLAPLDPGALLHELRSMFIPVAELKQQQLLVRMDAPLPALVADPARLRELLYNLVDNAIRYTAPGGRITVSAITTRDAKESEWVEFTVRDTGLSSRRTQQRVSAGLEHTAPAAESPLPVTENGLATAQRLAGLHGGRLRIESEPGRGSTFIVTLPRGGPT